MLETKSTSDHIRQYMFDLLQSDPNYFSTKSVTERNNDFKNYCELNSKLGLNYKNHRAVYASILSRNKDKLNLKLNTDVSKNKTEKFRVTKGTQHAEVTATKTHTTDATQQSTPTQSNTTQQSTPTQSNATQVILHPNLCQCGDCKAKRGELSDIDEMEAGGILEIIIEFWHSRNPNIQPMTEEEVRRVGKRLKPILQRHLGGDILLYGLGGISIAQVFLSRLDQRNASKKDNIEKKRDKANEKTASESVSEIIEKMEEKKPDVVISDRKFFNKRKIKEIETLGADEHDD